MVLPIKRTTTGSLTNIQVGDTIELVGPVRSDATASDRDIGSAALGFHNIYLNQPAVGSSLGSARALSSTSAGASGSTLVGVDTSNLNNSSPADGSLQTVLEALDAASGGGGGGSLQDAYDLGTDITQSVTGGILIAQGSASPGDTYVLRLNANLSGGSPVHGLVIQRETGIPSTQGTGISVLMGADCMNEGINVSHLGAGNAVSVATTGTGGGLLVDTSSGSGFGIFSLVATGANPIQAQINGVNAFTVDGTNSLVDVGASSAPLAIIGYSVTRMGSGTGTTVKAFEAYTTNTGSDPINVNNLGRLFMRPGTTTAASTVADLAIRAGSAGETLLTKGGRLFAGQVFIERLIENGVTLAAGEAVSVSATSDQVRKADASSENNCNTIGVCVVGGTGDGSSVYALIACNGVITGLSGLTANRPVFLSDSTSGLLTTTVPSTSGRFSIRMGFSLTSSSMVIQIGEKVGPL